MSERGQHPLADRSVGCSSTRLSTEDVPAVIRHQSKMCNAEDGLGRKALLHWTEISRDVEVAKGGATAMERRTVLIVDDDPAIRELIAEILDEAGYTVLEADCGRPALRLAQEHVPTVVLVDQMLPDMSGLDVLERLRAQAASRYIPVLLVSGLAHQLAGGDHGADRVLAKPFDIIDLIEQVDALAGHSRDVVAL